METINLFTVILDRQNRHNNQNKSVVKECYSDLYLDRRDAESAAELILSFVSLKELYLRARVQMVMLELTNEQFEIVNRQRFISMNVLSQPRS